jgi:hypothetical protein
MILPNTIAEVRALKNNVFELVGNSAKAQSFAEHWFMENWFDGKVDVGHFLTEGNVRVYRAFRVADRSVIIWIITTAPEVQAPKIETGSSISYWVTYSGSNGYMSPHGYEKYNERFVMDQKGMLAPGELIYGYEQAIDHIRQLRAHGQFLPGTVFYVEVNHTCTTKIPIA